MTARRPRWDPDDRGIGVADARDQLDVIDALRRAADEDGWVAEAPELHLLPHLLAHTGDGSGWVVGSSVVGPDGTFEVDARWSGPPDADRGVRRVAAFALIGSIAEGATMIHERRDAESLVFEVVTGLLPADTSFASHGHTLRLRLLGREPAELPADADD
jgi:hypothetical protein